MCAAMVVTDLCVGRETGSVTRFLVLNSSKGGLGRGSEIDGVGGLLVLPNPY